MTYLETYPVACRTDLGGSSGVASAFPFPDRRVPSLAPAMREVVSQEFSEMREKTSEWSETEEQFARRMMQTVIAPIGSAASKGERLRAAAQALRWKFSRARDVWYGDERVSLKACELSKIEEVSGAQYGRKEVDELDQVIARADALLQGAAPDFRSALAGAIREALRSVVGAGIEG